jgi:hypothetical protein
MQHRALFRRICDTPNEKESPPIDGSGTLATDISLAAGKKTISSLAWRIAAKTLLVHNKLITILKPGKGLPNYSQILCHN